MILCSLVQHPQIVVLLRYLLIRLHLIRGVPCPPRLMHQVLIANECPLIVVPLLKARTHLFPCKHHQLIVLVLKCHVSQTFERGNGLAVTLKIDVGEG
jgi:hypothetical protein